MKGLPVSRRGLAAAGAFVAILVLAGALRCTAIDFGRDVPWARPDEPSAAEGLRALRNGTVFPSLVLYGGGYFYPLSAFIAVLDRLEGTDHLAPGDGPGRDVLLRIRTWSAVLSLATVALVFVVGRRLGGFEAGLLAALIMATVPLAVREAHFAKPDSAAAFAVATFLLAVSCAPRGRVARAWLIGGATALAVNTKAVLGVVPAALLALACPDESRPLTIDRRQLWHGLAAAGVATLLLSAFWLSGPEANWQFARPVTRALSTADWLTGADAVPGPLRYHLTVSLRHGCGALLALLSIVAVVWGLARGGPPRVIAVFALCEWLKLLGSSMVLARFFLPIVPALAVLCALVVVALLERLAPPPLRRALMLAALAGILVAEPLTNSVRIVWQLAMDDTRSLAGDWIARELPADAVIVTWGTPSGSLVEWGVPPLGGRRVARAALPRTWQRVRATHAIVHSYPLPHSNVAAPPELAHARLLAAFDPFDAPAEGLILEPLDAFYLPLAHGSAVARPGPRIEIYELGAR